MTRPRPIMASPFRRTLSAVTGTILPGLLFAPGGPYQAVTGQVQGTVRYDQLDASPYSVTALTLLTLDVRSNRPNYPTFVDLNFYSEDEVLLSTAHEFICWSQVLLSDLNPNLTATGLSPKGLVVSDQAVKVPIGGDSRHIRAGHAAGDRRDRHLERQRPGVQLLAV